MLLKSFYFSNKKLKVSNVSRTTISHTHKLVGNHISASELISKDPPISLGEGSYGKCFLKRYNRLGIDVVEKQFSDTSSINDIIKETQMMQILVHPNIPTVLGMQLEKKPFSIVMEFIGTASSSVTVHQLLNDEQCQKLEKTEWVKLSYCVADALGYVHKMGFLHCDLKSNNIVVSNNKGYLIDFGKACPILSPPAKKYKYLYPHIAPEVLGGSPCSKESDIYSLGIVFNKISSFKEINVLKSISKQCMNKNPSSRPTIIGILSTLSTQNEVCLN